MSEALTLDPTCATLKVIIPTHLENYINDYHTNWCKAPVTTDSINALEKILTQIQEIKPEHLIEMPNDHDITQEHYDLRHNEEVAISDEVYAFQVNNSTGTQDTIDKSLAAGLPVTLHKKYEIKE